MAASVEPKGRRLKQKLLQSPMAGCTDLAYRKIARRFGCQIAFTEMVKDRPVVEGNQRTLEMLQTAGLGVAVRNGEPEALAAARRVVAPLWDGGMEELVRLLG